MPWTLVSTALSSVGSLGLAVFVLRYSTDSEYGQFGLAFTFYTLALSINRAICGSPLILLYSGRPMNARRIGEEAALSKSLVVGSASGLIGVIVLSLLPGSPTMALIASASMPMLLVLDTHRYVYFMREQARGAALIDLAWTGTQFLGFALLILLGSESAALAFALWGIAGVATALLLTARSSARLRLGIALGDIREHFRVIRPLVVEMGALGASDFLVALTIAISASQSVLGEYRAGALLLAPFTVVLSAMVVSVVPRCVRLRQDGMPYQRELNAGFLRLLPVPVFILVLARLLPEGLGNAILGPDWADIRNVATEWTGVMIAMGLSTVIFAKLRIEGRLDLAMWLRVASLPVLVAAIFCGVIFGEARGAVYGYGASTLLLGAVAALALRSAGRRSQQAHV